MKNSTAKPTISINMQGNRPVICLLKLSLLIGEMILVRPCLISFNLLSSYCIFVKCFFCFLFFRWKERGDICFQTEPRVCCQTHKTSSSKLDRQRQHLLTGAMLHVWMLSTGHGVHDGKASLAPWPLTQNGCPHTPYALPSPPVPKKT